LNRRMTTIALTMLLILVGYTVVSGAAHTRAAASHQTLAPTAPEHNAITVGWGNDDYTANVYTPAKIKIYVGDTVTWDVNGLLELHTVSFGPRSLLGHLSRTTIEQVPQRNGPPQLTLDPQVALSTLRSTYDGTGFASSGLIRKGQRWSLTFTRTGEYRYFCLLHFPGMSGLVQVLPRPAKTRRYLVHTGYGSDTSYADAFFPDHLTIHTGDSVTWTAGFHAVAFGPNPLLMSLRAHFVIALPQRTGPPHLIVNPRVAFPSGGPSYNGQGFHNSGMLVQGPTRLTFTRPGVYHYTCLIHPGMDGVITVLP